MGNIKFKERVIRAAHLAGVTGLLVAALVLPSGCSSPAGRGETRITENGVVAVLASMDAAFMKLDPPHVLTNFAADATITSVFTFNGETSTNAYDLKAYQKMLEGMAGSISGYQTERSDTHVEVAGDGKSAKARSKLNERFREDQLIKRSVEDEMYTFKLSGGRILIQTMHLEGKME